MPVCSVLSVFAEVWCHALGREWKCHISPLKLTRAVVTIRSLSSVSLRKHDCQCLHTRLNRAFTHLFFAFFCFVFSRVGFECFFFTHTANIGPQKSGSYLFSWDVVIFRHVLGKHDPIAMAVRPQRHASHNCIIKNNSWPAHYSFFERRYKDLHIWSCGSERRVQKAIQPQSLAIYKVYIAVVSSFKPIFWVLRAGK